MEKLMLCFVFIVAMRSLGHTGCRQIYARYLKDPETKALQLQQVTNTPVKLSPFDEKILRNSYSPPSKVLFQKEDVLDVFDFAESPGYILKVVTFKSEVLNRDIIKEYKGMQLVNKIRGTMKFLKCWEMPEKITYKFKKFHMDLEDFFDLHRKSPPNEYYLLASKTFLRIARYLIGLHNRDVTHGDLKLRNVMCITVSCIKLVFIDFGQAGLAGRQYATGSSEFIGPEGYASKDGERGLQTKALDIWALGALAFHIIDYRTVEYIGEINEKKNILTQEDYDLFVKNAHKYLTGFSPETISLLFEMCAFRPEDRPTIQTLFPRLKKMGNEGSRIFYKIS